MSVILLTIYVIFLCIFYAFPDCPIKQPVSWIDLVLVHYRLPASHPCTYACHLCSFVCRPRKVWKCFVHYCCAEKSVPVYVNFYLLNARVNLFNAIVPPFFFYFPIFRSCQETYMNGNVHHGWRLGSKYKIYWYKKVACQSSKIHYTIITTQLYYQNNHCTGPSVCLWFCTVLYDAYSVCSVGLSHV